MYCCSENSVFMFSMPSKRRDIVYFSSLVWSHGFLVLTLLIVLPFSHVTESLERSMLDMNEIKRIREKRGERERKKEKERDRDFGKCG